MVHRIEYHHELDANLDKCWAFFSDPANLALITPPDMHFTVKGHRVTEPMYAGQVIEYRLKPLLGIPVYWMTEITHVEPGKFFVDEQRFGPYAFWHHQHHFRALADGRTAMTDIVHYKLPMGWLGDTFGHWLVGPRLRKIFEFRKEKIPGLLV